MTVNLDDMLDAPQAAKWLKISLRELGEKSCGDSPEIPCFRISRKVRRFHPRTIIAVLARRGGISEETLSAMFGTTIIKTQT